MNRSYTDAQTGPIITGAIMLGAWLFPVAIEGGSADWVRAGLWALIVAAGIYGTRFVDGQVRVLAALAVGLAAGFGLMMLITFEAVGPMLSFLWVLLAGSVVASGMPRPYAQPAPQVAPQG